MAEHGARPRVPAARRRLLRAARVFFTPLLPDDYLELIDPLWSSRELRGRIESISRETADAVTVTIRPGWVWEGHEPGQYLRVGVIVDGVHHWRAYSITSDPGRPDGFISITPKLVEAGKVTPYLVRQAHAGTIVRLGGVEGTFTLPDPVPRKLLFISAGSGVTPIMSMLRDLARRGALQDVVHLHSARTADGVIFGEQLRRLAARHDGYRLHVQHTGESGPARPGDLDRLCPDWREREAFLSGPGDDARRDARPTGSAHGDAVAAAHGAVPAGHRRRRRRRGGRRDLLPGQRRRGALRRRHADPGRGRGGRRRPPVRLPDGDLSYLRGSLCAPAGYATCGPARCRAARARWSAPASTRPRGASRSTSEPNAERRGHDDREPRWPA